MVCRSDTKGRLESPFTCNRYMCCVCDRYLISLTAQSYILYVVELNTSMYYNAITDSIFNNISMCRVFLCDVHLRNGMRNFLARQRYIYNEPEKCRAVVTRDRWWFENIIITMRSKNGEFYRRVHDVFKVFCALDVFFLFVFCIIWSKQAMYTLLWSNYWVGVILWIYASQKR